MFNSSTKPFETDDYCLGAVAKKKKKKNCKILTSSFNIQKQRKKWAKEKEGRKKKSDFNKQEEKLL